MTTEPSIVHRSAQPYLAIRGTVTPQTISAIADRLPEVFGWLAAHGIEPAGAPFLRYDVIDPDGSLKMQAGVPVATEATGDADVVAGAGAGLEVTAEVLPAGRYATVTHVGHPDQLPTVVAALLEWAASQGLRWDMTRTDQGERWGCRLEVYHTDPREEPDPHKWETDLLFRLVD